MNEVHTDVACRQCGCVCDDLTVAVVEGRLEVQQGGCPKAKAWFAGLHGHTPAAAEISGRPALLDEALDEAAQVLGRAQSLLVYGLDGLSSAGQSEALALADRRQAFVDLGHSPFRRAVVYAQQRVGQAACTLGELRDRADVVVLAGVSGFASHPRFLERFLPNAADRRCFILGPAPVAELPDALHLPTSPDAYLRSFAVLRMLAAGQTVEAIAPGNDESIEALSKLLEALRTARYGVVLFGPELTADLDESHAGATVEALFRLTIELNVAARTSAVALTGAGGADQRFLWQIGYPGETSFAWGRPIYGPREFTAARLLARGEVDGCLILGDGAVERLPADARRALHDLPWVCVESPSPRPADSPTPRVLLRSSLPGVHGPHTSYRMDGVPLPHRPLLASSYPSDADLLAQLSARLARY